MATLQLDSITRKFGALTIIPELSLDIEDGEFVVLVGPSGCGKSTLLRLIAGLDQPSSGIIRIDGRDATGLGPRERGVGMVFQSYALYPHMNVRHNIGFGLKMARFAKDEITRRIKIVSDKLRLSDYLHRKPRELSGGQRQRVAIGRAMTREPELFLFDEPLSNLDAALRVSMRTEIGRLRHEVNSTIIYVTHDQTEAMTLADRIVILDHGRVAQVGAPLDLYDEPENRFVAGFVGSPAMNFLSGTIADIQGSDAQIDLAIGTRVAVKLRTQDAILGQQVELGIRPEHIKITKGKAGFTARAELVELLGSDSFIHLREGGETLTIRADGNQRARAGDTIGVDLTAGPRYLFDMDGARLA